VGCGAVGVKVVTGVPGKKVGRYVVGGTVGALGANDGLSVVVSAARLGLQVGGSVVGTTVGLRIGAAVGAGVVAA
jgi:hypothetical protein